jgi:TolB-like protein
MINEEIDKQVAKILKTDDFKKSTILSNFLTFIVTETLKGNADSLKEYVIGINVLKKTITFNPQLDSIVRIHAYRLRKKLEDYYSTQGELDDIIISIPKGRYVPIFNKKNAPFETNTIKQIKPERKVSSNPVLAVLPFNKNQVNATQYDLLCSALDFEIATNISQYDNIDVISSHSISNSWSTNKNINDIINQFELDYLISGNCLTIGKNGKIYIELKDVKNDYVIWSDSFFLEEYENNDFNTINKIVEKVVAMTCGQLGAVYRDLLDSHSPSDLNQLYVIYLHKRYNQNFSKQNTIQVLEDLEKVIEKSPNNALLLAFKGEFLMNLSIMGPEEDIDYLSLGTQFVKQSIAIDCNLQHGYQVLAWSNILNNNKKEAHLSITKMLSIHPNDVMYSGSAGFGYICLGDYELGLKYMSEAIDLNPYYNWYLNLGFCLYFLAIEEFEEAHYWVKLINRKGFIFDPLLRTAILGLLNRKEEAKISESHIYQLSPNFSTRAKKLISSFVLDNKLQETIVSGLVLAGVKNLD